jgi:hypothetical protein
MKYLQQFAKYWMRFKTPKYRTLAVALLLTLIFAGPKCFAQFTFPATGWNTATNLSHLLPSSAEELSGLYWNQLMKRLYVVSDQGVLYVLQMGAVNGEFSLLATTSKVKSTEAITQVNNQASEFYIIDEAAYQIQRFTHNYNFSSVTKANTWNLLLPQSTMTDTGNEGPEGLAFVPDSYLARIGFVSAVTHQPYTSVKGMNGLMFVAHQDKGYVWVFDVNPVLSDDYIFVGKYRTNRSESCELAFDPSTGLMYILHNVGDNYLEVTDLTTVFTSGEYRFKMLKEFNIPNPSSGSTNVEGFTLAPKFPENESMGAWLCRDVQKTEEKTDALRWFNPFNAEGGNLHTSLAVVEGDNPDNILISAFDSQLLLTGNSNKQYTLTIYAADARLVYSKSSVELPYSIDLSGLPGGMSIVRITDSESNVVTRKIINK